MASFNATPKGRLALGATALCAGLCGNAAATDIDTGNPDLQLRFDNTIRYNYGQRVNAQNSAILGNLNADDGDRRFPNNSAVNNRLDLLSELDLVFDKRLGARVSAAGWYDHAYDSGSSNGNAASSNHVKGGVASVGLSDYAKRYYAGPSGELLDAFLFASFDAGSMPVTVRAGRHTVNWGEALLGNGAIHGIAYSQAPLDLAKAYALPGIEAKELYRPLAQVSAQIQPTAELSVAAQYFFKWEQSRLPEGGTYLGFGDMLQQGGESLLLAPGVRALRGRDLAPGQRGDWGLALRWSPEWLDGTAGVYLRNFSDKLPGLIVMGAAPRQYFLNYGGDIDLLGLSLSKQVAGISFGADLNYRRNMPLVSDTVAVTSLAALPSEGNTLAARGNTLHGVLNAIGAIGSAGIFDSATWSAELTYNRWLSVTQGAQYFKGRDSYVGIDKVSKDYYGLALNFTPTWYQVFPGADLSMPFSYSNGISGNSAVGSGGNDGAGSYAMGLGLDLYSKYRFDLKFVDYFGNYTTNPLTGAVTLVNGNAAYLKDRGAVYLTFKTTF
jgi:hypothetical protein